MNKEQLEIMRHSCAHVVAAAVENLYPDAKFGIGPVVENGFYYDIEFSESISEGDLKKIEKKAKHMIKQKLSFEKQEMPIDEAIKFFADKKQDYKVMLLKDLKEKGTTKMSDEELQELGDSVDSVSIYKTGEFADLCRGFHVESTKEIGAFKLTKLAGAYWRGDENNPQLQRIYGLCFATKDDLAKHLEMLKEAEKRDHRKLGQELDLFAFSDLVGSGLPLFTEKGTIIREELEKFVWGLMKPHGYSRVTIPHIAKTDLYKTSGHWDKFSDDIFHVSSKKTDQKFVMKPMNCPHHTQIFASRPRSYRDLPIRMSEVTAVYRDENTGQLQGLSRVRSITQDDAHVFCTLEQVEEEVNSLYDIITNFYKPFGMRLIPTLSLHDPDKKEKYLGEDAIWEKSESILRESMKKLGLEFKEDVGEAAFYGPKIDFRAKDAIGREWQLATIQLDFNLPERFELEYVDKDGEKKRPVMIHRAVLGSVERFMSILIEHYAGAFPLWLSPVQVHLIAVSEKHVDGVKKLRDEFLSHDIRVSIDDSDETVGKKIRNSSKQKIPYVLVIGDRELDGEDMTIRVRGQEEQIGMSKEDFLSKVEEEIKIRK
jgi:threonyl-tRNA synthetase